MIVLTTLFNVKIPFNAHMVMITILSLVSLEFVDTDPLLERMFEIRETPAFETVIDDDGDPQSNFAEAGYESSNFLDLLGSIFFIILAYVANQVCMNLLRLVIMPCKSNRFTRWVRKRDSYKVIVIRFLLESCVELGLCASI